MEHPDLFQFSLDNSLEIVIMFENNGRIVYANQSSKKMLEYDEEIYANSIADIFPGEFQIKNDLFQCLHCTPGILSDTMIYRKNRTCFPVKMKFFVYEKDNESQTMYICMASDVSNESFLEKKANHADQEAEEAMKVKTEFVANVTHELRTPVNGISGNIKELIEVETDKKKLKLLKLVERGCRDMNAIINNILDFSKLEAGKFTLEPREFHFRNMIDYVKANHRNRITEKGLDFSIMVSSEIPEYIIGDELRIVQILNNLISNAYKFTSVGGIHVEVVKTAQSGKRIELFFIVTDTGIGIAKADQDKLFRSFSQVDASISRKYGGTGLGLNITKQLVELMNGNIHVESMVGKGTIFSFNIWTEIPDNEFAENHDEPGSGDMASTAERILIQKLQDMSEHQVSDKIWIYGEPENKKEVEKKMSKLILSMEMENWEKAEMFSETVKQLLADAPREVKSAVLRLKMAVQKGDYKKSVAAYENLRNLL